MRITITMEDDIALNLADALDRYNSMRAEKLMPHDHGWQQFAHNLRLVAKEVYDTAFDDEIKVSGP